MEELLRKMGPVYPILEKEEPPENKPEKGGQEEEPGQDKDKEKDKKEWEQHLEEKYLEEACQEVQRDTRAAKTRDFMEASEEYKREIQTAKEKFETRMAGKPGIILFPAIPHMPPHMLQGGHPTSPQPCNHDSTLNMEKQKNIIAADEFITDDESDNDHGQTNKTQFLQFLHCKQPNQEKDKLLYKYTSIPNKAHKCVTKVAEGIKDLQDQNQKQRRKAINQGLCQLKKKIRAKNKQIFI